MTEKQFVRTWYSRLHKDSFYCAGVADRALDLASLALDPLLEREGLPFLAGDLLLDRLLFDFFGGDLLLDRLLLDFFGGDLLLDRLLFDFFAGDLLRDLLLLRFFAGDLLLDLLLSSFFSADLLLDLLFDPAFSLRFAGDFERLLERLRDLERERRRRAGDRVRDLASRNLSLFPCNSLPSSSSKALSMPFLDSNSQWPSPFA